MGGFLEFIRERGVVGLAIAFMLGGAVTKLVNSFVEDIINPFLGLGLGFTKSLDKSYFQIFSAKIYWGNFIVNLIDFIVLAFVIYFLFKSLKIHKLDKRKEDEIPH